MEIHIQISNGRETKVRVESKFFLQDEFAKDAITILWKEEDTAVLITA